MQEFNPMQRKNCPGVDALRHAKRQAQALPPATFLSQQAALGERWKLPRDATIQSPLFPASGVTMAGYISTERTKAVTGPALLALRQANEKITMLTCYDASFAALMDRAGVEVMLVGDSLGMVCQGHDSTLPVSLQDVAYHVASVARGNKTALLVADMPFGTYGTPESAFKNAVQLIQAGAHMVKLEGGDWLIETVRFLTDRAVPVCAHLGLTPQSVHQLGGYKVQGKTAQGAEQMKADALGLQAAGASLLVLEAIPSALGKEVTELLVMHDLLGVFPGRKARFVKNFMEGQTSIEAAVRAYVAAVKDGTFPAAEHCF
jgi:3-methyl-2-oxobutanoate hydroxymethyltransferase